MGTRQAFINHDRPILAPRNGILLRKADMRATVILMLLAAIVANGAVVAADLPGMQYKARRVVKVAPAAVVVQEEDSLISPMLPSTPLLLGRQELPGYYGRAFSYDYQGPYYGGEGATGYMWRLPYACGVYGYC
jgi:hypothetical protein